MTQRTVQRRLQSLEDKDLIRRAWGYPKKDPKTGEWTRKLTRYNLGGGY
jgi:hypothetical protein